MKIFDFGSKCFVNEEQLAKPSLLRDFCVICRPSDLDKLQPRCHFDDIFINECTDSICDVRHSNRAEYEFIGLVVNEMHPHGKLHSWEVDLFVSKQYLVIVLPDQENENIAELESFLEQALLKDADINRLLYEVLHKLILFSTICMEAFEDQLELLQEDVILYVNQEQFSKINDLRKVAYTIRKHLRLTTYVSEEILVNENEILTDAGLSLLRDTNNRFRKLYGFTENLYDFSNRLLGSYDSRLSMKTNESVNKLTILTIFFGPLTVITGIYGMNFVNMPELKWQYGYFVVLGVMFLVTLVIYLILRRKKWL